MLRSLTACILVPTAWFLGRKHGTFEQQLLRAEDWEHSEQAVQQSEHQCKENLQVALESAKTLQSQCRWQKQRCAWVFDQTLQQAKHQCNEEKQRIALESKKTLQHQCNEEKLRVALKSEQSLQQAEHQSSQEKALETELFLQQAKQQCNQEKLRGTLESESTFTRSWPFRWLWPSLPLQLAWFTVEFIFIYNLRCIKVWMSHKCDELFARTKAHRKERQLQRKEAEKEAEREAERKAEVYRLWCEEAEREAQRKAEHLRLLRHEEEREVQREAEEHHLQRRCEEFVKTAPRKAEEQTRRRPLHWTGPSRPDLRLQGWTVHPVNDEVKAVLASFFAHENLRLSKAWRVEHHDRWNVYTTKRKNTILELGKLKRVHSVRSKLNNVALPGDELDANINECWLLHGTKPEIVLDILENGMNQRLANPGWLGAGIYLSEDAAKIDEYCTPDECYGSSGLEDLHKRLYRGGVRHNGSHSDGYYYAFVVRATCGAAVFTTDGKCSKSDGRPLFSNERDKRELSLVEPDKSHKMHYHSLVAVRGSVPLQEIVIFDSDRIYPEYLIAYKRERPTQNSNSGCHLQ